jgi:hypothetical protein
MRKIILALCLISVFEVRGAENPITDPAKALAVKTLKTIQEVAPFAMNAGYLQDNLIFFRSFYNPLDSVISAWPGLFDQNREAYANYAICSESAMELRSAGDMIHNGRISAKFIDEHIAKHRKALTRCEKAIKTDGKSEAARYPVVDQKLEILD